MFFEDWIDNNCEGKIDYLPRDASNEIIKLTLDESDAIALKLKGIPSEFNKYLTIYQN